MVPALAAGATPATRAAGRRAPVLNVDQLALFGPPVPHAVVERLRGVDVNTLTPLARAQLVAELAEQAKQA